MLEHLLELKPTSSSSRVRSRSPHPYHRKSLSSSSSTRPILDEGSQTYTQSDAIGGNTSPTASTTDEAKVLIDSTDLAPSTQHTTPSISPGSLSSSESGTEADDEKEIVIEGKGGLYLSKRRALPAPPRIKGRTGQWEIDDDERPRDREREVEHDAGVEGQQREVHAKGDLEKVGLGGRRKIVFVRRGLEVALMMLLTAVVCSGDGVLLEVSWWGRELTLFILTYIGCLLLQPLSSTIQKTTQIVLPPTLDPASILYPIFFPPLIALSLQPYSSAYLMSTLICALASLPPLVFPQTILSDPNLTYVLTLFPLFWSTNIAREAAEPFLYLPIIHSNLVSLGVELLIPSLTTTETRLLATALVNIYFNAFSAQMIILKTVLWGTGGVLLIICKKFMEKEVELERMIVVARSGIRARRRGNSIRQYRFKESLGLPKDIDKIRKQKIKANGHLTSSDESDLTSTLPKIRRFSDVSQTLPKNIALWKYLYAIPVYVTLIFTIIFLERPYIAKYAFDGLDPFFWAAAYLFSGLPYYQDLVTTLGLENVTGLDVTDGYEGKWGPNYRLGLAGFWLLMVLGAIGVVITLGKGVRVPMEKLGIEFQGPGWLGLGEVARGRAVEVDTRRKVFHMTVVIMFLPSVFLDPQFVSTALVVTLAIFLLLDIFRATLLPPLAKPLSIFLAPYVDGRDLRGPIVVSHVFLLIGCAMPLWLSLAGSTYIGDHFSLIKMHHHPNNNHIKKNNNTNTTNNQIPSPFGTYWLAPERDLAMIAGVISVGMGDAAASLIGRRFGKHKWGWSGGKSIEGSIAFTLAVAAGLLMGKVGLISGGFQAGRNGIARGGLTALKTGMRWDRAAGVAGKVFLAGGMGSLVEAVVTGGNDNIVLPLVLWLAVRGLGV